jgi:predicted kinase
MVKQQLPLLLSEQINLVIRRVQANQQISFMTSDKDVKNIENINSKETTAVYVNVVPKNELLLNLHTIILMVGPSAVGKSYFAEKYLIPKIKEKWKNLKVSYVSSDQIRRNILQDDSIDKYDPRMMQVSTQAFELLYKQVEQLTSYPVNHEFVIVDTKGISEELRERIAKIASDNAYNLAAIVFDYRENKDYFDYLPNNLPLHISKMIQKDIDRLKTSVLPTLTKNHYQVIHKIKSPQEVAKISIKIIDLDLYKRCHLSFGSEDNFVLTSDLHGCYKEFKEHVSRNKNKKYLIVGDIVDKGANSTDIVKMIWQMLKDNQALIIKGNHENYVYKALTNQLSKQNREENVEIEKKYFNSIKEFEADNEARKKFIELYESSLPFAKIEYHAILTHAPSPLKYLGKMSNRAFKEQQHLRYPKRREYASYEEWVMALNEFLGFLKEEGRNIHPKHFFGHIPVQKFNVTESKYSLDGGGVIGGRLRFVTDLRSGHPKLEEVIVTQIMDKEPIPRLFSAQEVIENTVEYQQIPPKNLRRIKSILNNKVNFISTATPSADKSENELESLVQGLSYYRAEGINKIILQKKYTGSRTQIYLFKDEIECCYAVNSEGEIIRGIDLTQVFELLLKRFENRPYKMLIIDGQLLPQGIFGNKIIKGNFKPINQALERVLSKLEQSDFYKQVDTLDNQLQKSRFSYMIKTEGKERAVEYFGSSKYSTYLAWLDFRSSYIGLEEMHKFRDNYSKQMQIYVDSEKKFEFKAFSLLKEITAEEKEISFITSEYSNIDLFSQVSDDECLILDLTSPYCDIEAKIFYDHHITEKNVEGVVIKPEKVYNQGIVPFIKVRNADYLALVYGLDYQHPAKLKTLMEHKDISTKFTVSIDEFDIAKKMLQIPYNQISYENKDCVYLLQQLIEQQKKEEKIDPRL